PVAGTFMVEPTESESQAELDRFCDAMIAIREEIRAVEDGRLDRADNPLRHAPHTAAVVAADQWDHAYTRDMAAFPVASLRHVKYWSPVGRADNVYGDRNLVCSCPPTSMYECGFAYNFDQSMRILLSNDDAYFAPGLAALAEGLAGLGEITVVAPERDRSGASNSLTLDRPLTVLSAHNGFRYVDGTPTDCVHMAV